MQETQFQSLGWEGSLEEEMATHSSIPAWEIPWTEEPGGPQSMGSQRVRAYWETDYAHIHKFRTVLKLGVCFQHRDSGAEVGKLWPSLVFCPERQKWGQGSQATLPSTPVGSETKATHTEPWRTPEGTPTTGGGPLQEVCFLHALALLVQAQFLVEDL